MNKKILTALSVTALLFTSCNKSEEVEISDNRPVAVNFKSGISLQQTRAVGANWELGDNIGVYMVPEYSDLTPEAIAAGGDNRSYTATADGNRVGFTADPADQLFYPNDGSKMHFKGYYPYKAGMSADNYTISTGMQSSQQDLDFMVSAKTPPFNKYMSEVTLEFRHMLSKVEITLKAGDGITVEELQDADITFLDIYRDATYSLELEEDEIVPTGSKANILAHKLPGSVFAEAIIVPQSVVGGEVQITIGGDQYLWVSDMEYVSGAKYVINITVNRKGMNVSGTISDWTTGEVLDVVTE